MPGQRRCARTAALWGSERRARLRADKKAPSGAPGGPPEARATSPVAWHAEGPGTGLPPSETGPLTSSSRSPQLPDPGNPTKSSQVRRLAVCLLALALLVVAGCSREQADLQPRPSQPVPVLLVGVDGFEWNVVLPLLREGRLPHIQKLMEEGIYGTMKTQQPTRSPAIRTTIATGKTPEVHGIDGFLRTEDPPILRTSADRKAKAFRNILSERRRTVDCIGWWVTFPVEEINGVLVAQSNTWASAEERGINKGTLIPGVDGQVHPEEYADAFLGIVGKVNEDLTGILDDVIETVGKEPTEEVADALEVSRRAYRADTIYEKLAIRLLSEEPAPDLMAVYFGTPDVVGHRFWKHMDLHALTPEVSEPQGFPGWSKVISHSYERVDRAIGNLRKHLPRDAVIMIISDPGMRPWGHHDAPASFFVAAGPGIKKLGGKPVSQLHHDDLTRVGSVMDVLPTLLALVHMPAARDMSGSVMDRVVMLPEGTILPRVDTYDTPEWVERRAGAAGTIDDSEPERLEQLRSLGYIK